MTRILALIGLCGLIAAAGCSSDTAGGTGGTGGTVGDLEWPPDAAVYLDEYGIFHGDCATDEDCTMALGYFHARDRFV
ncbi:MAG: penicillin acylase family protein, partial [Deltaproteobacteria bacterium]|nr:penicillin acylase family protein [Deltaproteobacteria bacterium]